MEVKLYLKAAIKHKIIYMFTKIGQKKRSDNLI